jgi:ParB family chromosome partitioning protein
LSPYTGERLKAEADALQAEGWAWIEASYDLPWRTVGDCDLLEGDGPGLPDGIKAEGQALVNEWNTLKQEDEDQEDEDQQGERQESPRQREIRTRLAEIDAMAVSVEWSADQKARSGGWVFVDQQGRLSRRLGYIWPTPEPKDEDGEPEDHDGEDESPEFEDVDADDAPASSAPPKVEADGLSFPLIEDLSAHYTAALQAEIAERPDVAYLVLLHRIVQDTISWSGRQLALDVRAHSHDMEHKGATVKDSPAASALRARLDSWKERLPDDSAALWQYLVSASDYDRADILAVCVATCLQAVIGKGARGSERSYDEARFANGRHLASVVGLDMSRWWRPTAATYLGAVSKDLIIEALADAGQIKPGEKLASTKKADLVALAEDRLVPTTWLPALLRTEAPSEPAIAAGVPMDLAAE